MRLEIPHPYYEGPTLEGEEKQIYETSFTKEDASRIAGRLAVVGVAYHTAYLMPGAELATLEATLATVDEADNARYSENAQNN